MEKYFCIHSPTTETCNNIQITEQEYCSIKEAKEKLIEVLFIEEKYNFIIENFLEFEKELINITFDKMISPNFVNDWLLSVNEIHLVNRRIINLLTTSRLYIDQIEHDIKTICFNDPNVILSLKTIKSQEYDTNLGFRVMEALRNYVQHRGLPIHTMKCKRNKQESFTDSTLKYIVSPLLRFDDLDKDKKFKKSVLEELRQIGDNVDLKKVIREYIQSINNIHCSIRGLLSSYISEWDTNIENAYMKYEKIYCSTNMIGIAEIDNNGFRRNNIYLLKDTIKRRKLLEQKNPGLSCLINMFASSEF